MAYIAAAVAAGVIPETVDVPTEHQVDWVDYLEGTWSHRLAAYRQAPDASSPASADQLRRIVAKLITVERHYLTAMGFFYREYRNTWGFHRRKDNSLFDTRFERAARIVMERERADSE